MEGLEIFICNVKAGTTSAELKSFLAPLLKEFNITVFEIFVFKPNTQVTTSEAVITQALAKYIKKPWVALTQATLTTHDGVQGNNFLQHYQNPCFARELLFGGINLTVRLSKNKPNEFLVRVLKREEKELLLEGYDASTPVSILASKEPLQRQFSISAMACGNWEYIGPQPDYRPHYELPIDATVTFGDRCFVLEYVEVSADNQGFEAINYPLPTEFTIPDTPHITRYEVRFYYSSIVSFVLDRKEDPSVICTLTESPKIWANKVRAIGLKDLPLEVSTSCQVYRLRLVNPSDIAHLLRLEHTGTFPRCTILSIKNVKIGLPFIYQMTKLKMELDMKRYHFNFAIKFQIQKLAQNGYLSPRVVLTLLDYISLMQGKHGPASTVAALRKLFQQLPYAGPSTQAADLDTRRIVDLLSRNIDCLPEDATDTSIDPSTSAMSIHKVDVTPTGIYLAGPDQESSNRVLRNYAQYIEYFLRVTFMDEDGEKFHCDRYRNNSVIFHARFRNILQEGIEVGGRTYEFLGFSTSSLRAQTCWFLAPFITSGQRVDADLIISKLGDFSHIRCPAKCAARIGQAFTETSSSIPLDKAHLKEIEDVERHGRVFSDGAGTCSSTTLATLQAAQKSSVIPATAFQIRYAGAKGMISLDNRLRGNALCLRPSMIKYRGSEESSIEICGVASRMLPLVLNRQLIKILEDLGVPNGVFEDLQNIAINELRASVSSVTNAASFLEKHDVGLSTQTTWLLRKMDSLGLALSDDAFFRDLLDAVVLCELQELKYETRIPVKEGATLYGIMDEFDYLAEGEVFVPYIDKLGRTDHARGVVVIARSPALHPGDIQTARAITVPANSPLSELHNCIVFSSKGLRDLPSQLGGGDLDGDLFHVMWDPKLIPPRCVQPASYPRSAPPDLGRPVTRQDVASFFIQFMEQDMLGRVATQHKILADQCDQGTLDKDCIKLAGLHSTAVDFPKTGRPASEKDLPLACRHNTKYRPDFMAPGRKVKIEKHGIIFAAIQFDMIENDDPRRVGEQSRKRYYESNKILGILYRSIDERSFFKDLHASSAVMKDDNQASAGVLAELWDYVQTEAKELEWDNHIVEAVATREEYESVVYDIILQHSTHPTEHLEEIEVFIGNIIARNGDRSKRQKEYATGMKETYDREVLLLMSTMRDYQTTEEQYEALCRSMAYFFVGIQKPEERKERIEGCRRDTFGWVAAAACLKELERYQEDRDVGPLRNSFGGLKVDVGI
ncbi:MAG: hypothetical protein Q9170_004163 [Blastenia crenularia]